MRTRKKIKRNLEVALVRGLKHFARSLPRSTGLRVFSALGQGAGVLMKKDRQQAIDNLGIAFPEMVPAMREAMMRAMYKSLGYNAFELLNLQGSSSQRVVQLVERVEGQEHLDAARATGKGLIGITGHIGCWELLAAYWANSGYEVNVVGRKLWESRIDEELVRIRESVGYRTIDRDCGGKEMARILRNGEILAVLIDQHTRVSGTYVPFFNRPAHTPTGVARLAMVTGARIVPMAIYMTRPGRHMIRILPALDLAEEVTDRKLRVEEITRRASAAIEDLIRHDPKQWVWFHRRWRAPEGADLNHAAIH